MDDIAVLENLIRERKTEEKTAESIEKRVEKVFRLTNTQRKYLVRKGRVLRRLRREVQAVKEKYRKPLELLDLEYQEFWGVYPFPKDMVNRRIDTLKDIKACPCRMLCLDIKKIDGVVKCMNKDYLKDYGCDL